MPKKSDSKDRMIAAARRLFREHGYVGTALSEVVTESAAPRGSVYFHFPGGKEELATEVTLVHAADAHRAYQPRGGSTRTAAQLIEAFIGRIRDELVASNYREGCADRSDRARSDARLDATQRRYPPRLPGHDRHAGRPPRRKEHPRRPRRAARHIRV